MSRVAGLLALAALGCGSSAPMKIRETSDVEIQRLGPRTYVVLPKPGMTQKIGSNSGFIVTSNGLVLIDTQISREAHEKVLAEIRAVTDAPVAYVVSTHWHDDHVGGNEIHARGVEVIAHRAGAEKMRRIDRRVDADLELVDGVRVYALGHAHSVGDLAVYDTADGVLYMGDAYVRGFVGYLGEGSFKEWIASLDRMLGVGARTVVPGHGLVDGPEPMREYRDYIRDFVVTMRAHLERHGKTDGYELPAKYKRYGARFFLPDNFKRAFDLWKAGKLGDDH